AGPRLPMHGDGTHRSGYGSSPGDYGGPDRQTAADGNRERPGSEGSPPRPRRQSRREMSVAGLLLAMTITVATRFTRPTWVDIDPVTGDIWFVNRADNTLVRIHEGVVNGVQQLKTYYVAGPTVTFNFDGPFGGGLAIEPAGAGCGAGPWGQGFYVSN